MIEVFGDNQSLLQHSSSDAIVVELQADEKGMLWINVNGICVCRCSGVKKISTSLKLSSKDGRKSPVVHLVENGKEQWLEAKTEL